MDFIALRSLMRLNSDVMTASSEATVVIVDHMSAP